MERPSDYAREAIKQLAEVCRLVGARAEKVSYEPYLELPAAGNSGEPPAGRFTIHLNDAAHRSGVIQALGTVLTDGEGKSLVDIKKGSTLRNIAIDLVPEAELDRDVRMPDFTNREFSQHLQHGLAAIRQQPDEFKVLTGRQY